MPGPMLDLVREPSRLDARLKALGHDAAEPIWCPDHVAPPEPPCELPAEAEAAIVRVLDAPLRDAATTDVAYADKERAILALVDELEPIGGLALARRIQAARREDPIISRLLRLAPERQSRIGAFITDSKRRAARSRGNSR